jgi:hypothetical protein
MDAASTRSPVRAAALRIAPALLVAAAAAAPLVPVWLAGKTLMHRDDVGVYAPLRSLAGSALRGLRLPLWNPFCATGMPFFAETIHGVLHPVSIAAAFLSPADGLDPLIDAWIVLAAVGSFLLARTLGASRAASVLAGIAYGLSGPTLSMSGNLVFLAGAACSPWVVAALRAAGTGQRPSSVAGAALAVASGALAGDVQGLVVALALGVALSAEAGRWRGVAAAVAGIALGLAVGAIQLAPSWAYLAESTRALGVGGPDRTDFNLSPWRIAEWISPGLFAPPEDGVGPAPVFLALTGPESFPVPFTESVFIGAIPLVLAMTGVRAGRSGRVLAGAVAILAWFALGHHLGARALQDHLPLLGGMRYGEKFLAPLTLCVAALAALGADRLAATPRAARRVAAVAAAAGVAAAVAALLASGGRLAQALGAPAERELAAHLVRGLPHVAVASLGAAACLAAAARGRCGAALVGLGVLVWLAALATAGYALRPGRPEARIAVAPPPLEAPAPGPRVFNLRSVPSRPPWPGWNAADQLDFDQGASLAPNMNAWHRIDHLLVDSGLPPLRWARVLDALPRDDFPALARRFSVTHLLFPPPRTAAGIATAARFTAGGSLAGVDPRVGNQIWAVPHRPWASFPGEIVYAPGPDAAIATLVELARAGSSAAVVESDTPLPAGPGRVLEVERGTETVRIVAEAATEATLVVNDAYAPGWRAEVDGAPTAILPADGLVRAIHWPAGRHALVMRYEPPEVRVGAWITLVGLVGVAALLVAPRLLRSSRAGSGSPSGGW